MDPGIGGGLHAYIPGSANEYYNNGRKGEKEVFKSLQILGRHTVYELYLKFHLLYWKP